MWHCVERPVAGKQTISEPPCSSLQERCLAIAELETVFNDQSGKTFYHI
jgi:hypothetical protein